VTTFTDDFNRADGSPGANWVQVSGAWTIISQQLSSGTTGTTVVLRAATAMATSDNYSQVTIAATTSASQGVWCRGDSTLTSGYAVRNNGTNWALFSVTGGTFTSIGTYAAAAVAGDVVKIQAVGSTITVYINGVSRISVTNTAVTTGTSVGIRSDVNSALRYDDFTAADVASGATGDAALSATATLSASGVRATAGSAALASTATLTAGGVRAAFAAAGLASTASLSADGTRGTSGAAGLTASAVLTASGTVTAVVTGNAALSVSAALGAAGAVGGRLDAALAGTAALTAAGAVGVASGGGIAVSVGLTASGQVAGVVVRGTARGAAGSGPRARRGESAVPTARGGAQ
jgi:hypothetical protein